MGNCMATGPCTTPREVRSGKGNISVTAKKVTNATGTSRAAFARRNRITWAFCTGCGREWDASGVESIVGDFRFGRTLEFYERYTPQPHSNWERVWPYWTWEPCSSDRQIKMWSSNWLCLLVA